MALTSDNPTVFPNGIKAIVVDDSGNPSSFTQQAAIADITDSGGGATANGTIEAVTAPTALTDNGGGTADGTVASQAAPVTLTDNTGASGTHDDTLADGLTATAPAAITNYTAVVNMTDPVTKAEGEAVSAALATLEDEVTALRGTVAAAVTDLGVQNQNDSDLAQKVIQLVTLAGTAQDNLKELTTRQAENRTAIVALTDAVKELSTKQNATLAALRSAGVIAT